jgi:outer membrane protein assembly factor BamB
MKRVQLKKCVVGVLLAVVFLLPYTCSTVSNKQANWPMFMHDIQNTGCSFSAAPDSSHLLWTFNTEQRLFGSPIVYNGILYQVGRGFLFAIDAETGELVWSLGLPVIGSTPMAIDESLYVGTCNGAAALNLETGDLIWHTQLADFTCDPWNDDLSNFIASSPKVTDTGVIICTNRNISASYGYPDPEGINRVICLDSETGALIWQHALNDRAGYSPAIIDERVFINSTQLRVLDEKTGQLVWLYSDAKGFYDSSPVINHGCVLVIAEDKGIIHQIDIITQELLWKYDLSSTVISTPAVHDNKVIVVTSEEMILALDEKGENILWKRECYTESDFPAHDILKNAAANFNSSPAIADNKIYIGLRSGEFLCLNLDTGETLWQYMTVGSIIASPAVADERVFISSTDGKIYCFGINPETYFDKAEKYEEQGDTDRTKEFYTRAREYYQSQDDQDMVKKCDARLQEGSYSWIVVLVGCLILGVLIYVKAKV